MNGLYKYLIVTVALTAVTFCTLSARNPKRDAWKESPRMAVRVGVGGYPMTSRDINHYDYYWSFGSWSMLEGNYLADRYDFGTGSIYSTGTITSEFDYVIAKWFTISMNVGMNHMWGDKINPFNGEQTGKVTADVLYLVPEARFTYMNRPAVRLYSGIGLGAGFCFDRKFGRKDFEMENSILPQVTLFGAEFGKRLIGFYELSVGGMYSGVRGGIGYRF